MLQGTCRTAPAFSNSVSTYIKSMCFGERPAAFAVHKKNARQSERISASNSLIAAEGRPTTRILCEAGGCNSRLLPVGSLRSKQSENVVPPYGTCTASFH
jgi:hypothetical protein